MAELAVVMSMITVMTTAANILGMIKRRCGSSQTISELATKCTELVIGIRKLLESLEEGSQMPVDSFDTRRIQIALNLRRAEFSAVLKKIEVMKRRISRKYKFVMAQGWARKMEAIHNDLVQVRNGIESILSSWDVGQFVARNTEQISALDASRRKVLGADIGLSQNLTKKELLGSGIISVDRIQTTIVKLTEDNKLALSRWGNLDKLSVPDALFNAGLRVACTDQICSIQLMQRSAELLHPEANWWMGVCYELGSAVEQDLDLAVYHFRTAISHDEIPWIYQLMKYYNHENDGRSVLKYVQQYSNTAKHWQYWNRYVQYAIKYNFGNTQLVKPLIAETTSKCTLQKSICHFFGVGEPRSLQKAVDTLRKLDSKSYYAGIVAHDSNLFYIQRHHSWDNREMQNLCEYLNFLFEANEFLPFLILSYSSSVYTPKQWEEYAMYAADSHCVDSHIMLAHNYLWQGDPDERKIESHVRIAAGAGHSEAQSIYRHLYGKRANLSRELRAVEAIPDTNQGEEHKQ